MNVLDVAKRLRKEINFISLMVRGQQMLFVFLVKKKEMMKTMSGEI